MRICIAGRVPSEMPGGVFRIMEALQNHLEDAGHMVEMRLLRGKPRWPDFFLFPYGLAITVFWKKWDIIIAHSNDGALCAVLSRISKRFPPVIMHSHGWEEKAFEIWDKTARQFGARPNWLNRVIARFMRFPLLRLNLRFARACIFASHEDRNWLAQRVPAYATRLGYIPNGIDFEHLHSRSRTGDKAKKILFVGNWTWKKGNVFLIPILRELLRQSSNAKVLMVGSGIPESMRDRTLRGLDLNRIEFHDNVDAQKMGRLYRSARVLIHPSLFEGGIPSLTLLEAMACGVPIVAFGYAGLDTILENGRNAVVVEPGNWQELVARTLILLRNPQHGRVLAKEALQTVKGFGWDSIIPQWQDVLAGKTNWEPVPDQPSEAAARETPAPQ